MLITDHVMWTKISTRLIYLNNKFRHGQPVLHSEVGGTSTTC